MQLGIAVFLGALLRHYAAAAARAYTTRTPRISRGLARQEITHLEHRPLTQPPKPMDSALSGQLQGLGTRVVRPRGGAPYARYPPPKKSNVRARAGICRHCRHVGMPRLAKNNLFLY